MDLFGNADAEAVAKLMKVCDEAYARAPKSCSHAALYVLNQIVDLNFVWLPANKLIEFLLVDPGWKLVSVDVGNALAQKGVVVIGGCKEVDNGHVVVMYPGPPRKSGGYLYTYKDKITQKMKTATMRSHGDYPPVLSTSMGQWPGAMSKGDKTVWDPWANDAKFATVKFWAKVT